MQKSRILFDQTRIRNTVAVPLSQRLCCMLSFRHSNRAIFKPHRDGNRSGEPGFVKLVSDSSLNEIEFL